MNVPQYIYRSLLYFRRSHLALIAGVTVAVTIIVGALAVGDSVRKSLLHIVDERLGEINYAMVTGKYFPKINLAENIEEKAAVKIAPLILLKGSAMSDGGADKIPEVNLFGINNNFMELFSPKFQNIIPPGEALVNRTFAEALGISKGDVFIIRIPNPGIMPEDIALTKEEDSTRSLRLKVMKIADQSFPGNFTLKSGQNKPKNVFVNLDWIGQKIERKGRCNLILAGKGKNTEQLNNIVRHEFDLEDIGLEFNKIIDPASRGRQVTQMTSDRIFIEDDIAEKALSIQFTEGILTYFVNSIRNSKTGKSCPYSFVTAVDKRLYPVKSDKDWDKKGFKEFPPIVINSWLAEDLDVKKGDIIELKYFLPGRMRKLVEQTTAFRISDIVLVKGWSEDKNMMPDFPGLADTDNCSDWDPGIPIDLKKVREKDEAYWDHYKGIPKAFIDLKKGREIWANQFGSLTAVRFQKGEGQFELQEKLLPENFGLSFIDIAAKDRLNAKKSVDFGELFLGLSFFIIFSALILTAMLFALSIKSRANEIAILSNLGFRNNKIHRILMLEHSIPALIGALAGIPLGMVYNRVVIHLLNTLWKGAVGTSVLKAHISVVSAVAGSGSGLLIALITMFIILSSQIKKSVTVKVHNDVLPQKREQWSLILGSLFSIIAAVTVINYLFSDSSKKPSAPFFASGGLLLVSSWCFIKNLFNQYRNVDLSSSLIKRNISFKKVLQLSVKNCTCNILRSMAGIILLSCGIFLTLAVAVNLKTAKDLSENSSGTGGYKLFVKTSLPVVHDLNTEKGLKAFNLDPELFKEVEFLQMRLSDGNEASCFNLNRVENPAILGVDFSQFAERKAFTFKNLETGFNYDDAWNDLNVKKFEKSGWYAIPVVADNDVIMWIMGKKVGDSLKLKDENGKQYNLLIAGGLSNSIFQGYVLMSEKNFIHMNPASSGSRVLLVDCPDIQTAQIELALKKSLAGLGVEIEKCSDRLRRFQKVENTYLSIFLILGGLGLIIGAAGFGIVVIRNIIERKKELAIMHALGFNRILIRRLVITEHVMLILLGSVSGVVAAGISAIPAVISARTPIPWNTCIALIAAIIIIGVSCVFMAALSAVAKHPLKALRKE